MEECSRSLYRFELVVVHFSVVRRFHKKPKKNTRTSNNTGSIRQRPNGLWEARVVIGTDPATGKQVRKSVYGEKEKDVRRKVTEIQNALDNGTYQEPSRMKVSEWLEEWLNTFCTHKLKPYTIVAYRGIIKNHLNPAMAPPQRWPRPGRH